MLIYKEKKILEKLFDCGDDNFLKVTTHTDGYGLELRITAVSVSNGFFFKEELFRRPLLLTPKDNDFEYIRLTGKGFELDSGDIINRHPELRNLCQEVLDETYKIMFKVFNMKAFL